MDVVGKPAHRQRIETALAGLAVEQGGYFDRVGIEQVQDRGEDALEVDEPVLVSPLGDPASGGASAEQEIGWLPGLQRRLGLSRSHLAAGRTSSICLPVFCSKAAMISWTAWSSWG